MLFLFYMISVDNNNIHILPYTHACGVYDLVCSCFCFLVNEIRDEKKSYQNMNWMFVFVLINISFVLRLWNVCVVCFVSRIQVSHNLIFFCCFVIHLIK